MKPIDKRKANLKRRRQRRRERKDKMTTDAIDMRILRMLIVPADPMAGH